MKKLFLLLGITSLVLAPFDFVLEGVYEGLLPLSWAAFFFFLAFRDRVSLRSPPTVANMVQWLLGFTVLATGVLKLLHRLDAMG